MEINCYPIYEELHSNSLVKTGCTAGSISQIGKKHPEPNAFASKNDTKNLCNIGLTLNKKFININSLSSNDKKNLCTDSLYGCRKALCKSSNNLDHGTFNIDCGIIKKIMPQSLPIKDLCVIFNSHPELQNNIIDFIFENIPKEYEDTMKYITKASLKSSLTTCICTDPNKSCDGTLGTYLDKNKMVIEALSKSGLSRPDICTLIKAGGFQKDKLNKLIYSKISEKYKKYINEEMVGTLIDCTCAGTNETCEELSGNLDKNKMVIKALSKTGLSMTDICTLINTGVFEKDRFVKFVYSKISEKYKKNINLDMLTQIIIPCICPETKASNLCNSIRSNQLIKDLLTKCEIQEKDFMSLLRIASKNSDVTNKILGILPAKYECIVGVINIEKLIDTLKCAYPEMNDSSNIFMDTINSTKTIATFGTCFNKKIVENYKNIQEKKSNIYLYIGFTIILLLVSICLLLYYKKLKIISKK